MKVIVFGGAGFVGSHLVDLLVKRGEEVVVVDNFFLGKMVNLKESIDKITVYREDARYLTALEHIFERENPETVYDLAVQPLPYSFVNPEGAYMTSVEITHNLVHLLHRKTYKKLIHFSSSEAYGNIKRIPMDEKHPLNPTTPYGAGKASADLMLMSYHELFNLNVSIIRPFNIYGPRQNVGTYAAVIPLTIKRILNGEKPVIEGDGKQTRDFTYVSDVVEAALKLSECDPATGKIVNVGQGKEISIKEVIGLICSLLKYPFSEVVYAPPRPADVRRHFADVSLAKKLWGYSPKISFEEGLNRTIESLKGG